MLVDLPEEFMSNDGPLMQAWRNAGNSEANLPPKPVRLSRGVYEVDSNFDYLLELDGLTINDHPFEPYWGKAMYKASVEERLAAMRAHTENDEPHDFGVCDHPDQILARWPQLETDPRNILVYVTKIDRDEQSEGGWRWHKWGPYIGVHEPQCEYLRDEPDIESVYVFAIVELL